MDDILQRLALLLRGGNKFGGNTFGGQTFGGAKYGGNQFGASAPMSVPSAAAPPPVNPMDFGVPQQDVAPAPASPVPPEQTMPPTTVAASPFPAPAASPAQEPVGMPAELHPSLAVPATQASPGMAQVPQTMAQLEEWRKLMDAMQFARQGT